MSNFIVLVKQVPDVTKINDNCFNPETGTLLRAKLPSVLNDLDSQALSMAAHMRRLQDGRDTMVLLTMGPPMADEVLRFGLKRGADAAVLLTDKAFGGADTVATANPLANAIRKIARDFFNNDADYYVLCGMQSVDGDTAQVPPQVAEELGVTCVTYATGVEKKEGRFEFTRIMTGGSQTVAPIQLPAVITVAKYETPLFPTFSASRQAANFSVTKWGKDDVKAILIGLDGSKTSVAKVFQPDKSSRKCLELKTAREMALKIVECFKSKDSGKSGDLVKAVEKKYLVPSGRTSLWDRGFEATPRDRENFDFLADLLKEIGLPLDRPLTQEEKNAVITRADKRFSKTALDDLLAGANAREVSFPGEVWVMAEHTLGVLNAATLELLGKARELADTLQTNACAVIVGAHTQPLAHELISHGADKVYHLNHPLLEIFDPLPWRKAVAEAVVRFKPAIFLFSATPQGRTLAPLVSYRTGNGLTADCTGFDIRDMSLKNKIALLFQTRPALGGNIMATIWTKNSTTQMATARPGVFKRFQTDTTRKGEEIDVPVTLSDADSSWLILRSDVANTSANFDAEIIVSGGKGVRTKPNYNSLTGTLIDALSKKLCARVEKGASRAAVEHGFVERAYQVGQTGTAVGPEIYLALGISGAIQHMIGIANTKSIFAVNNDPNAPIFKQCDYYLVGSVDEIVPGIVQALQEQL
jgi:electron transfer flavoprotein alpha subunit